MSHVGKGLGEEGDHDLESLLQDFPLCLSRDQEIVRSVFITQGSVACECGCGCCGFRRHSQ